MKILHTSDFHLGAKTEGFSRAAEQRNILHEIVNISESENIDIVVIAGDIFHVANPSAEAEDMFYEFLEELTKNNDRVVLVISGNHDDPKRLGCVAPLAKRHNIVLCTDLSPLPNFSEIGQIKITKTGRGFVEIQKGTETVCAAMLPYASESRILPSLEGIDVPHFESYQDNVHEWAQFASKDFKKDSFNLFITHQYVVGAHFKEGIQNKTVVLGEALAVPASAFPESDYTAVGHLHTCQKIKGSKNAYYSGSTIKLRQYDDKPRVLIFDTKNPVPKEVFLSSAADIVEVKSKNVETAINDLQKINKTDLVYLTLTDTQSITTIDVKELRNVGPTVLTIKLTKKSNRESVTIHTKSLTPSELFSEFVLQKTGEKPSNELLNMFLDVLEDPNETNRT